MEIMGAMKQALDALESDNPDIQLRAAIALRQAIEQAEQQEPVAWISEGGDVSRSKRYMDEMGFKCNPLYTAPPQRKPLTDEKLIECERLADIRHRKHMGSIRGQQLSPADQFLWHYARAIEAAHGIGEKE